MCAGSDASRAQAGCDGLTDSVSLLRATSAVINAPCFLSCHLPSCCFVVVLAFQRSLLFPLRHVTISLGPAHLFWHVPDENGAFAAGSHDEVLVGGDSNLGNSSRVADTLEVLNSLVVVPDFD